MAFRRRGKTESISTLILRAYPDHQPEDIPSPQAMTWWRKTVSKKILKNARPVRLSQGVLTIHTSTSVWANSLQYESESLLKAISSCVPEARVRKLHFQVGPLPELVFLPEEDPPTCSIRPLTELPENIAQAIAKIKNDDVRDAVAYAAAAGLSRLSAEGKQKQEK